jgi:hypothetical protein
MASRILKTGFLFTVFRFPQKKAVLPIAVFRKKPVLLLMFSNRGIIGSVRI